MNIHHCRVCKLISISFIFLSFLIFLKIFPIDQKNHPTKMATQLLLGELQFI